MKRAVPLLLFVVLVIPSAVAKKNSSLRAELLHAKFVFVTNYPGEGQRAIVDTRTYPGDRRAIIDTENAIRKWGRWTVLDSAYQADLIISVRRGRAVGMGVGGPVISIGDKRRDSAPNGGPTLQTEVGPVEDMIVVFAAGVDEKSKVNGAIDYDAPALWRLIRSNALMSPTVPGIQELRKQIEKAEAENAKN